MLACETGCCYGISRTVLHQYTPVAKEGSKIPGRQLCKGEAIDVATLALGELRAKLLLKGYVYIHLSC